jgi:outer membrane protein assembly factor BamB
MRTDKVIEHYSEKDGVPIKYVCTTDLHHTDSPEDIYYRDTPHPTFGNKYFSLRVYGDNVYIANADKIEEKTFGCVEDDDGNLQYSQFRHEYKTFNNGNMIDGGREYIRSNVIPKIYFVKDGTMVERK